MIYDTLIVGGGPAGLTAAIYSLRAGKKVALLERTVPGGQVGLTHTIENYPGFKIIDGSDLAFKMFEHASSLGLEVIYSDVLAYDLGGLVKSVRLYNGTIEAKTVILCMGASAKELNLENEKKFLGKGVSYCATCDGNFFKDKDVAVVGGGNTSLEDALYLSGICRKVYLLHRRDAFRGDNTNASRIIEAAQSGEGKIELVLSSEVKKILGDEKVEGIVTENKVSKTERTLPVSGLFIAIGRKPDTDLLRGTIEMDESGYIITDEKMRTSLPGVFAAGDVRKKQLRQIVTACADGAIASINTSEYILENVWS